MVDQIWLLSGAVNFNCACSESLRPLLRALKFMMYLGLFHDWSPLAPILWLSSPTSKAHCLQIFLYWIQPFDSGFAYFSSTLWFSRVNFLQRFCSCVPANSTDQLLITRTLFSALLGFLGRSPYLSYWLVINLRTWHSLQLQDIHANIRQTSQTSSWIITRDRYIQGPRDTWKKNLYSMTKVG